MSVLLGFVVRDGTLERESDAVSPAAARFCAGTVTNDPPTEVAGNVLDLQVATAHERETGHLDLVAPRAPRSPPRPSRQSP